MPFGFLIYGIYYGRAAIPRLRTRHPIVTDEGEHAADYPVEPYTIAPHHEADYDILSGVSGFAQGRQEDAAGFGKLLL